MRMVKRASLLYNQFNSFKCRGCGHQLHKQTVGGYFRDKYRELVPLCRKCWKKRGGK